jgi:hypothetical protein
MGSCGTDSYGSRQGEVVGSCKHGNGLSGSISGGNFLTE